MYKNLNFFQDYFYRVKIEEVREQSRLPLSLSLIDQTYRSQMAILTLELVHYLIDTDVGTCTSPPTPFVEPVMVHLIGPIDRYDFDSPLMIKNP